MDNETPVRVDGNGFVFASGVKICRVTQQGTLQFFDKDRARSDARGSRTVEVRVEQLVVVATKTGDTSS